MKAARICLSRPAQAAEALLDLPKRDIAFDIDCGSLRLQLSSARRAARLRQSPPTIPRRNEAEAKRFQELCVQVHLAAMSKTSKRVECIDFLTMGSYRI